MRKLIYILLAIATVSSVSATSFRRDFFLMYKGSCPERAARDTFIADTAMWGITMLGSDMDIVLDINPNFIFDVYITAQDLYVRPSDDTAQMNFLDSLANARGWSKEIFYTHFWDTTVLASGSRRDTFPAYQYAVTPDDSFDCRVAVYNSNGLRSRRQKNYSTANAIYGHIEFARHTIQTPNNGHYYDAIFFDNSSYRLFNIEDVVSGGHIYEAPGHPRLDSIGGIAQDTNGWWWQGNLEPFYIALKDTFRNSAVWMPDGKQKRYGPNIDGTWTDTYADSNLFYSLAPEYNYTLMHAYNATIPEVFRRDSLCADHGIVLHWTSAIYTTTGSYAGSFTYPEALVNNLCMFYISHSDSSTFLQQGSNSLCRYDGTDWDTLVWCGAMDYNVGAPVDNSYSIAQIGTDGEGYSYTIYKRQYQNALILARGRGHYDQNIDVGTAVTYNLGDNRSEERRVGKECRSRWSP